MDASVRVKECVQAAYIHAVEDSVVSEKANWAIVLVENYY